MKLSNKNTVFFVCSRIGESYSTADQEQTYCSKASLLYIFFVSFLRLTTLTCKPDDANRLSQVSAALSPFHFCLKLYSVRDFIILAHVVTWYLEHLFPYILHTHTRTPIVWVMELFITTYFEEKPLHCQVCYHVSQFLICASPIAVDHCSNAVKNHIFPSPLLMECSISCSERQQICKMQLFYKKCFLARIYARREKVYFEILRALFRNVVFTDFKTS